MTEIDWVAVSRFRRRSLQYFSKSNFAYTYSLELLLDRLKIMHVSSQRILLCGVTDASSNHAFTDCFSSSMLRVIDNESSLGSVSDETFDVILVNLIFSISDIETVFSQLFALLKPGGVLLFSLFGSQTLRELKQAFGSLHFNHVCSFYDMHDLGDSLQRQRYDAPVMENIPLTVRYSSVSSIFRDLRNCGAQNPLVQRPRTFLGKNFWARVESRYPKVEHRYPVTLDLVLGHAWKKEKGADSVKTDEYCVSVESIRRKKKDFYEKN
jgi:SAM-dependent methyltransferase